MKLKLMGLAKLLVAECILNQNPFTTWDGLVEALSLAFCPSNYQQDMAIKWLCL
jgi:hypothetical protein